MTPIQYQSPYAIYKYKTTPIRTFALIAPFFPNNVKIAPKSIPQSIRPYREEAMCQFSTVTQET